MAHVVIVGAGQGGIQAAMSLRQQGFDGAVTLIGDEPGLPYERPPLSKAYMKEGDADALSIRPESWFEKNGVDLRNATRVSRIDREARTVATEDGATVDYDHLILAVGSRNAAPPIDGLDRKGVFALRSLSDATALRDAMAHARRAVIIGGGFIGLEYAAVARAAGLEVVVVEMADRLMSRVVTPPISQRFLEAHRDLGVDVRLGTGARAIVGNGTAEAVRLSDRTDLTCDLVLVATGVLPNTELADAAGLAVDNGIVVDGHMRTQDNRIFALGDVAAFPGPHGTHVRLESVQAATDHARHIAEQICAGARADHYAAVPWFWSDQADLRLQIAGLSQGADDYIADDACDVVFSFADDRLVAVETVNQPIVHMAARKVLARPERPDRKALDEAGWDLRAYAKQSG